jgi:chromosomal replication initiation ATPase DnaA
MTLPVVVPVDRRLRFETFVVGASNRLAVSAAHAVADAPGEAYNPLFIYGESGRGKTHLIAALAHRAQERQPSCRVVFTSGEAITDHLHTAVAHGQPHQLFAHYQQADLLILDDVQFLTGQRETQSELLRLLTLLLQGGQQLVLTSDRPPAAIHDVDQRLLSRLSGGLVVDLGAPDFEMRLAILRNAGADRGVGFAEGVLEEVARIPFGNVRELKGAFNKLTAFQQLEGTPVTPADVRAVLGERVVVSGDAASAADPAAAPDDEGFLSDVQQAVEGRVEPWRITVGEALARWRERGYTAAVLERALGEVTPPDVEQVLADVQAAVEELQQLELQGNALDPALRSHPAFRDIEALPLARQLVQDAMAAAEPLPAPDPVYPLAAFEPTPATQLALTAIQGVLDEPGRRFNPLLLHGPPGSGKTHLAHAVGLALQQRWPAWQVACLSADAYVDGLVVALQEGRMERWRQRFRAADLLILDDIQHLMGKERTQDELFHLFNHLMARGGQLVLTSDRPPHALFGLADRLRSRFEGGLVVALEPRPIAVAPSAPPIDRAPVPETAPRPGHRGDPAFLDQEKVMWAWGDVGSRLIEEYR